MSFIFNLLTLPVTGPTKGLAWLAKQIGEQAEKELYGEDALRGKLMELELAADMGEISEEEFLAAEEIVLERLRIARERKAAG